MKYPRFCVLRNRSGEYLTPIGSLSKRRREAAVVPLARGIKILCDTKACFTGYDALSVEELSKHERRTAVGLSDVGIGDLRARLVKNGIDAELHRLKAILGEHERAAAYYRAKIAKLEPEPDPNEGWVGCGGGLDG